MVEKTVDSGGERFPANCWYAVELSSKLRRRSLSIPFLDGQLNLVRDSLGQPTAHWNGNNHLAALERHGFVWVWVTESGTEPQGEPTAVPELVGLAHRPAADLQYHFKGHYSRTIENQIDPTHAVFTHGGSVGRVDPDMDLTIGPYRVDVDDYQLYARVPTKVKKINGLMGLFLRGGEGDRFYKEYRFIYPNVAISTIHFGSITLFAMQAHIPLIGKETVVKATNARNFFTRTPGLSHWFDAVTKKTGNKISREDDAIIKDQLPAIIDYKGSNDVLVSSDRLPIEFRKMMHRRLQPQD
jgi:phenylpropionate dioxygenase-like ring-hydroxylating dioxygenase large terminal subunit